VNFLSKKIVYFEDVNVGDEISSTNPPVTRVHIAKYAGASGDFNPIHVDEEFAKNTPQKTVIAHGMMTMGYVARMLTDWLPDPTHLKRLKVEFRGMVFPGDTVTCKGKIVDKYQKNGKNYVKLEVWAENQRGEKVAIGEAEAVLPSKS